MHRPPDCRPRARGISRRATLAGLGVAVAGLAGCLGSPGGSVEGAGATPTPMDDGDPSATATPTGSEARPEIDTHPGAAGLDVQPRLGPGLDEADAVIVAFEDPSCTTCRRFEERSLPGLRRDVIDPGHAAFVFRVFPVIYPWGKPATQALEATYARDEAAFWALKEHYYATQREFDADNVLDRTEAFLDAETALDAAAVVEDARENRFDAAVQADLEAGRASGFSATPSFLLFRDGALVTSLVGAKSPDVFATALRV